MSEGVFIAVGSNIGDALKNCSKAIEELNALAGVSVVKVSSMYRTAPWGKTDQPDFINCAIEIDTTLTPQALLALLKETEERMGRVKALKWGPRLIDLDIVFYGSFIIDTEGLTIPHPHLKDRSFVLEPLNEIAPEFIHPVLNCSVAKLAKEAGSEGVEKVSEG